ncbi:MAG: Brp/Blh family beta-carotene 15,15'-dioxygenase [Planctomycetota bacterium]
MDGVAVLSARFERHRVFALVVTAVFVLLAAPLSGRWAGAELALAGAVIVLLGLPHGALDALIALRARDGRGRVPLLVAYVGLALLTLVIWKLWPVASLASFLLLSLIHFGRGDVPHSRREEPLFAVEAAARGALPLLLPVVFHPEEVSRIFSMLVDVPEATVQSFIASRLSAFSVLSAAAVVTLAYLCSRSQRGRAHMDLAELAALCLTFALLSPLLAFALYFGAWHSMRHLLVLHTWLGERDRTAVVRRGLPILAVTLLLGGLGYAATADQSVDPRALTQVLFIGLAALTVPHMFVTWVLDRQLRSRP